LNPISSRRQIQNFKIPFFIGGFPKARAQQNDIRSEQRFLCDGIVDMAANGAGSLGRGSLRKGRNGEKRGKPQRNQTFDYVRELP
jgi:hypothetical protein